MYGKFFASAFTGSMYGAGPDVFAVWAYVIANAVDSQVELNPKLLAGVIGMTTERATAAIAFLCAPDAKSRSKVAEGRRLIQEGEIAYRVVNHETYRAIRSEEDRRAYNREKQREHRARVKARVNDSQSLSSVSAQAVSRKQEAEGEANNTHTPGLSELLSILPAYSHTAVQGYARRARHPESWVTAVAAMLNGMGTANGKAVAPDELGRALAEMAATSTDPSPANIRAFLRRAKSDAARGDGGKNGKVSAYDHWVKTGEVIA